MRVFQVEAAYFLTENMYTYSQLLLSAHYSTIV